MNQVLPEKGNIKSIILDNFSNREISLIMRAVKSEFPEAARNKQLIFAKTTEQSKKMTIGDLLDDTKEDHLYLLANPPQPEQSTAESSNSTDKTRPSDTNV